MGEHITADWAWISKRPGAREDYDVLARSAARIDAGGLAAVYVTGTPSSSLPADDPGTAPWVTFGSHRGAAGGPVLSVSVTDPWRDRDQTGRPIWPRRLFACWYDEIAAYCPSYRALWEAVAGTELPPAGGEPVPLTLRPDPADRVIAAIGGIGLERAAAIAAALLDGPVVLTGAGYLRLCDGAAAVDRLGALDAAAALLPYGFRVGMSASSAVDNAVAHRIRLVLGSYATAGQRAAGLRDAPLGPGSGASRDYLAMLLERVRWDGLPAVVAYLRDATAPCAFDRPEAALEILGGLNRPRHAIRNANEGAESLEASLAFFGGEPPETGALWRHADLDPRARTRLLRPLLDSDDRQAAEILGRNWSFLAADVAALLSRRLDDGNAAGAARSLAVAESLLGPEAADRLLCVLVSPPDPAGLARSPAVTARAALLQQRPAVPAPGTFGRSRASVGRGPADGWQGALIRELLSAELSTDAGPGRAVAWVAWLTVPAGADPPEWLTALAYTAGAGDGGQEGVRTLVRSGPAWAAVVLRLATRAGRVHDVLEIPGLADDLVGLGTAPPAASGHEDSRPALAEAAEVPLWDLGVDPAVIAAVDVARTLLGGQPPRFPDGRPDQFARYDQGMAKVLELPAVRGAPSGARLDAVRSGLRCARAVDHLRTTVEQVIASPEVLSRYADERFGVPASVLALAMYRAWRAGMPVARIHELMARTSAPGATLDQRVGYRELDEVLREFADLLAFPPHEANGRSPRPDDRRAQARDVLAESRELVCAGGFGTSYGLGFRRHLDHQLRDELLAVRQARRRLRRPIRSPAPPGRQRSGPTPDDSD